jgi:NAD(P)-dependent dehydrogenase (short-subunit alcohol dehydrogenase family)
VPPGPSTRRLAIVVGASRGIGLAIGRALGLAGWEVLLAGRTGPGLASAAADLARDGVAVRWVAADASRAGGADQIAETVGSDLAGRRSLLVYAAGVFGPITEVSATPVDEWRSVIETNLLGALYMTRLVLPYMLGSGWGRIVYVSSKAALSVPGGGASAYVISKIGLNRLAEEVAAETEGSGVTANSIHPGDVKTEMWAEIRERSARAGPAGAGLAEWAATVDRDGGDAVTLGAEMVMWLVDHPEVNGQFLLPETWRSGQRERGA